MLDDVKLVPMDFYEKMTKGHLEYRDVLINKDGAQTGKVGIYTPSSNGPACINEHVFLLRGNEDDITQEYLYYCLLSEPGQRQLRTQISGSAQPGLKSSFVHGVHAEIPHSVVEQSKIAEILTTIDRVIEQTESLISKQKRIKIGLMQDIFTHGIDEQGNLRSEENHQFKDSPLGRIPVEWEVKTINDLAIHVGSGITPRGGESVYTPDGVLFIRSQNVHFGGLVLEDVAFIPQRIHSSMKRSEVFENDVSLNITGASIGRCCRLPELAGEANVNQHVCAIRLPEATESDAGFLNAVIESSIGQNQILQFNAGGNREGLNYQQVRSFLIPWPKDTERHESYLRLQSASKSLTSMAACLNKLRSLKTALMQDLLTGEKRVTPLLEPAMTT